MRKKTKRSSKGMGWMAGGLLLIAAALFLMGYNLWDEHRAALSADRVLDQIVISQAGMGQDASSLEENTAESGGINGYQEAVIPDYQLNPDMEMPEEVIDHNKYIGVLAIPVLDLSLPVMSDWSYPKLKTAPCRYLGSAYTDSLIIAGHNYRTHFGGLKILQIGDKINFTDVDGNIFSYEVENIELLEGSAVEEMEAGDWDLTLFTCTYGGKNRVTVRCGKSGMPEGES